MGCLSPGRGLLQPAGDLQCNARIFYLLHQRLSPSPQASAKTGQPALPISPARPVSHACDQSHNPSPLSPANRKALKAKRFLPQKEATVGLFVPSLLDQPVAQYSHGFPGGNVRNISWDAGPGNPDLLKTALPPRPSPFLAPQPKNT